MTANPHNLIAPKIIRTGALSPFGRMARMAGHALGLDIPMDPVDTNNPDDHIHQQNPLSKIPCMVLADNSLIHDSTIIIHYLDAFDGQHRLLPDISQERFIMLTDTTIAKGIAEAGLLIVYEARYRDNPEHHSQKFLSMQQAKLQKAMDYFVENMPDPQQTNILSINLSASLSYLDFRKQANWRVSHPTLSDWLEKFAQSEPAYEATKRPDDA